MSSRRQASDARRSDFKNQGLTQDEFRRRREETSVELRKAKKEDSLNKRRNIVDVKPHLTETHGEYASVSNDDYESSLNSDPDLLVDLERAARTIYSNNLEEQLRSVTDFRKKLSKEKNPPIAEVMRYGVTPRFVELLVGPSIPPADRESLQLLEKIQFEAAWALTNIASGSPEETQHVVQLGTVPIFIRLLQHANAELRDQCIWALGNIAGDCPEMRDMVLASDVMYPLLMNLNAELDSSFPKLSIIRNATWTLSNMCRGRPVPAWNEVVVALPTLARLIHLDDQDTLADACWTLSYLSDVPPEHLERLDDVVNGAVIPMLVKLTGHRHHTVQTPALRAIGNIVTGNAMQTQAVIDAGGLFAMRALLGDPRVSLQKEACWAISNVTAGTAEQIQSVLEADICPKLIHLLAYADLKVKREACWALCNATSMFMENPEHVKYLVSTGCIKPLCDLLTCPDIKIILVTLGGLGNILEVGEQEAVNSRGEFNPYAVMIEECGGLDLISDLQMHKNNKVYEEAKSIIDKYFHGDDDFDLAANDTANSALQYQAPSGGFNF